MGNEVRRTKLRAKTGCLTCRSRRKKCDETYPSCSNCTSSLRRCQWPTSDDLIDRRHASHRSRQSTSPTPTSDSPVSHDRSPMSTATNPTDGSHTLVRRPSFTNDSSTATTKSNLCRLSETTAHEMLCHDIESVIFHHFSERYYSLLILPNCNPDFFWGWINDIRKLMVQYKSLQYSVLACGASHLHFVDASSAMQELSLTYYSNSLKGLSELLGGVSQLEDNNGVLMSVMLLYLHGCMGRGTYTDIPRHVNAAMRILRMRLLSRPSNISRPFDRLAIESVLYQVFLVVTGAWSDPFELDYHFDSEFWLQAERLLAKSNLYPHRSISFNSPVIGVPLALFRIIISLKQLYQNPWDHDEEVVHQLRSEVEEWEGIVLSDGETDHHLDDEDVRVSPGIYRDAAYLYVLVSSLLMDQISIGDWIPGVPQVAPRDSWQLKKAIQILRGRQDDPDWSKCFIGNWPIYSLGFFLDDPEGIELVRNDMQQRWDVVRFSQIMRFREDLETTWAARGSVPRASAWSESLTLISAKEQPAEWIDALG